MRRIATLTLLLLSVPLLLSSCGEGEPSDEEQISGVVAQIQDAETEDQLREVCGKLLTPGFLEEVYLGDVDACVKKPPNDEGDIEEPGETAVESVTVNGPKAKAKIVTVGGDTDGTDGTWSMVDDDGQWQLDRLEDNFLRASFRVSVVNVDEGLFSSEPLRKCMLDGIDDLDPEKLRRFIYLAARDDKPKGLDLGNSIAEQTCPSQLAGYVADVLADQVIAGQGASKAVVECARRELKPLLLVTGLSTKVLNGADGSKDITAAAIAGLIAGITKKCPAA